MSEVQQQALIKTEPTSVEYVPYGAQDKVKMTVGIIQNLIAVKTKTGKTCSERDAIRFMAMCQAKRMNPFEGDCFLIGYDSKDGPSFALVTAHQTYLKRAELHPEFDGMKSGLIVREELGLKDVEGDFYDEGQQVVGGWATVYFKNRKQPMHKRLRLSRFQKPFGIWQDDPAGMICKCAEADALRSSFPTMLGGLYLREEIDILPPKEFAKPIFASSQPMALNGHRESQQLPDSSDPPGAEPETAQTEAARKADALGAAGPDEFNSKPVAPAATAAAPAEPLPVIAPAPEAQSIVRAVRGLCKIAKIKEGALLEYLSKVGLGDGSNASLEDLQLTRPEVLQTVHDRWTDVADAILRAQKEQKGAK